MMEAKGSVAEQIVQKLQALGPEDDGELGRLLGKDRVHINIVARNLERRGILRRAVGAEGKILNTLLPGRPCQLGERRPGRRA
jgi:hypothetical protein